MVQKRLSNPTATDRDDDGLVVGHVGDVRCRSSVVGEDELLEDGVPRRVQVDVGVVRLGSRLVGMIQQQVHRHVLATQFNRTIITQLVMRSMYTDCVTCAR